MMKEETLSAFSPTSSVPPSILLWMEGKKKIKPLETPVVSKKN